MKKIVSLLLLVTIYSFGQNELSIEIMNAKYKVKEPNITLDLKVKNNSDSVVYIIRPKNYFFNLHLDQRNQLGFHGLSIAPYTLEITANKKCKIANTDYMQIMQDNDETHLKSEMVEIEPHESKTFEDIKIERYDGDFCKKRVHEIQLKYKSNVILMDDNLVNELKEKYSLIKKETDELNRILYYNASNYRSSEKDNFKKLTELFDKMPKMRKLNNIEFVSNKIIAVEI